MCVAMLHGDEKGAESKVRASREFILGQAKIVVAVMHQNAYPIEPAGSISQSEVQRSLKENTEIQNQ